MLGWEETKVHAMQVRKSLRKQRRSSRVKFTISGGLMVWRSATSSSTAKLGVTERADREALPYTIALCALLLASPVAWPHHYTWLLPACVLALGVALRRWLQASERAERRVAAAQLVGVCLAAALINLSASYLSQRAVSLVPLRL